MAVEVLPGPLPDSESYNIIGTDLSDAKVLARHERAEGNVSLRLGWNDRTVVGSFIIPSGNLCELLVLTRAFSTTLGRFADRFVGSRIA